jgi:hypothetical protein
VGSNPTPSASGIGYGRARRVRRDVARSGRPSTPGSCDRFLTRRNVQIAAVALALLATAAVIAIYAMRAAAPTVSSTPTAIPTSTPVRLTVSPSPTNAAPSPTSGPVATSQGGGAITGRFAYGSDFIPPVTVYAISTADPRVWYSVAFPGVGNPPRPTLPPGETEARYTISGVAPGMYWVVAYRNDGQLPDPGYYSRQPDCFRTRPSGPCPDVTLVPATVIAGQTTSGIDVITWWPPFGGQPSPTFPPRPTPR